MDVEWRATLTFSFGFLVFSLDLLAPISLYYSPVLSADVVYTSARASRAAKFFGEDQHRNPVWNRRSAKVFLSSIILSPATTKQARTCAAAAPKVTHHRRRCMSNYKPSWNRLDCIGREEIYRQQQPFCGLYVHVYSAEKSKPFNALSLSAGCVFLFCSASSGKMTGYSDSPTKWNSWINEGKYKIRVRSAVTRHSFSAF